MTTALLVEDSEDVRFFLEAVLTARYNVRAFESGAAAVAALAELQPRLVLSDLDIQHTSGEEVARAAVRLPERPRVVLMSGDWERLEGVAVEVDAILRKPFTLLELWTAIAPITPLAAAD